MRRCNLELRLVTLTSLAPTGGAEISLTNGNPAVTMPAAGTVPAGVKPFSFTFTIPTAPVPTVKQGSIYGLYNTGMDSAFLEVQPPGIKLVTLVHNSVSGGTAA
jgi:hypothetical protein